ncbi:MAG: HIRAN domain-containing protein [Ruminococcus flavefaciens]|nr:HIRAN domain-containing protein [Ruminococcus flavefaciens]
MAQIQNVDLKVVGVTFTNEGTGEKRSAIIRELASKYGDNVTGITIELKREQDNKYDANAVMVLADGKQIGYIGKEYAAIIAPMMDDCEEFTAVVKGIGEYKNRPYCEITINQLD